MVRTILSRVYFGNGVVIENQIAIARAMALIERPTTLVPPDADYVEIRGVSQAIIIPTIIILVLSRAFVPRPPIPTKASVYDRDAGTCAYCGKPLPRHSATIDHVIPRAQGGQDTWHNLVLSCARCNQKKGNQTPGQAGMRLLHQPYTPRSFQARR